VIRIILNSIVSVVVLSACSVGEVPQTPTLTDNRGLEELAEAPGKRAPLGEFAPAAFDAAKEGWEEEADEFDGVTRWRPDYHSDWYLPWTDFNGDDVAVYPIIRVSKSGIVQYLWVIQYVSEDWIFFEQMLVIASGETREFPVAESFKKQTKVSGGTVFESSVTELSRTQLENVKAIVDDPAAKLRVRGKGGSVERGFTTEERKALGESLQLFMGFSQ
jgi:hypothetical protein